MKYLHRLTALLIILAFACCAVGVSAEEIRLTGPWPEDLEKVREDKSYLVVNNVDATVKVQESIVKRNINQDMLGMQYEGMGDSIFDSQYTTEISDTYKEFAPTLYPITLARFGGSLSGQINAFDHMGPVASRKSSTYTMDAYSDDKRGKGSTVAPQQFGVVEWIKLVQLQNPEAQFIMCISLEAATPEDNANLVSFFLDEKDESQWGALRASYGIEDPINLHSIEVGNEVDLMSKNPRSNFEIDLELVEWYCTQARRHIDAIKAVHPETKFMACGKSSPHKDDPLDWRTWHREVAKAFGEDCHYWAYHLYHGGYHLAYTEWQLDAMTEDFKEIFGEDYQTKIYITEHATWPNNNDFKVNMFEDNKTQTLYAALDNAQFFNRMYTRDDVYGANYHAFFGAQKMWAAVKKFDGQWVRTNVNEIAQFYSDNLGDRIVQLDIESDNVITDKNSTASRFTAIATPKGDNEMVLMLNNMSEDTSLDLTFEFENKYTLTKESVFTAPNLWSYVCCEEAQDIFSVTTTEKNEANFTTYHMPAKSCIALTLKSDKKLPRVDGEGGSDGDEEAVFTGESGFSDIEYSWAKNEINLLHEQGLVDGMGEGIFAPDADVTRAQAAKMAATALGLEEKTYSGLFDDVSADDWYAPYVQTMYENGYMLGKTAREFAPEDGITKEELAVLASRIYMALNIDEQVSADINYLNGFKNKSEISVWAENAVAICVEKNIFRRMYESGLFVPRANANRAETAYVLYRLINS